MRVGQWIFDWIYGVKPGGDAPQLKQLVWARRAWRRSIELVFVALVGMAALKGRELNLFVFLFGVVVILVGLFEMARLSVRIWRERRALRRALRRSMRAGEEAEVSVTRWFRVPVDRVYGAMPGDDAPSLEQLLWTRRAAGRSAGLVSIVLVVGVVLEGEHLIWFVFVPVVGVFVVALFLIVCSSALIWRERRGMRRGGERR
jgi:hypothetical protein